MSADKRDSELREIYRRCDVSNNGTVDPMGEDEFVAWVKQYAAKERISGQIEALQSLYDSAVDTNAVTTSFIKFVIGNCKEKLEVSDGK